MVTATAFVFFLSIIVICYVYLGYPMVIWVLARVRNRSVKKGDIEPNVSILISAHNEEESIQATIENKLALDYPRKRLEIIVVSDGSTDRTEEIVERYAVSGVKLIRQNPRAGKTSALNLAVPEAKGDILVFSDANSIWADDALRQMVRNFADPAVGYVTGRMIYTSADGNAIGDGCTAYMRYENFLRFLETRAGSVVGVDGGIDGIRKNIYVPMRPDQLPDFVLPLAVLSQGKRVVYEPAAVLREQALQGAEDEYRMRVRVTLRSFWAICDMRHLLSLRKHKLPALQLWSHKVLRYMCFVFLIGAYLSNLLLWAEAGLYSTVFIIQNAFYGMAGAFPLMARMRFRPKLFALSYYFVLINAASAHAFFKFLRREKLVVWQPRKG
jgi:glycosyltransferase involved in cell wall biosynthesis